MLIINKLNNKCNLQCSYCSDNDSLLKENVHFEELDKFSISSFFEQVSEILDINEPINLLLHGGEPTLSNVDYLEKIVGIIKEIFGDKNNSLNICMQTNGFHISDCWIDTIRRHKISIGVSIDGPELLHDRCRLSKYNQATYSSINNNINKLLSIGTPVSLLCVVQPGYIDHVEEFGIWLNERNLPIRFNRLRKAGKSTNGLDWGEYFEFLRLLFKVCCEKMVSVPIQPLEWMFKSILYNVTPVECSWNGMCGEKIISIFPDGTVRPCLRSSKIYGNISSSTLKEMLDSEVAKSVSGRNEGLKIKCDSCEIKLLCNGGCPEENGEIPDDSFCETYKSFVSWLRSDGLLLLKKYLINQKNDIKRMIYTLQKTKSIMLENKDD